jgi:hypothetical protein
MRLISSCARTNSLFKLLQDVSICLDIEGGGHGPLFILDVFFLKLDISGHVLAAVLPNHQATYSRCR